jgi:hypothetical protein
VGKFGRKICCNFDKDAKCILLIKGHRQCIFEETSKEQHKRGEQQIGFCAFLPQSERDNIVAAIKKEDLTNFRSWKD